MMEHDKRATAVLGALVADAAAMGLHWLYDPSRIAEIGKQDGVTFIAPDAANFAGVPGYFAHQKRVGGQGSQYGVSLMLGLQAMSSGRFDVPSHQDLFVATFGPGGDYTGYIDRPTRGTLDNIAAEKTGPTGIDDDQLPALARLPAVVAYGAKDDVILAMQVTNVNDVAMGYGLVFADVLQSVMDGVPVPDGLKKAAEIAPTAIAAPLQAALLTDETDSVAYGEVTARACHLPQGMPLAFHIMTHATDYTDAVERNIRAGGDSCGRSIIIGAIMGAAHGIEGKGIPLDWVLKTDDAAKAWAICANLGASKM